MLRRISVLLLSALFLLALTGNVALAQAGEGELSDKGQPGSDEDKKEGSPTDPNAWGSVTSQLGIQGVVGEHSSDPPGDQPRDGLGNVARNDATDESAPAGSDTGDHVADHACIADNRLDLFDASCGEAPGGDATERA